MFDDETFGGGDVMGQLGSGAAARRVRDGRG
jgi:hypothetical protein